MATQRKIDAVTDLTAKLAKAKSIVLADYRGLKHKQMEELRKVLKKSEGELTVGKNRLFLKAFTLSKAEGLGAKAETIKNALNDTTAALFAYADEVAPLKELLKYFKTAGAGKTKAGLLGTQVLSDAEMTRLAALPSREVLLGRLVGQLNAPIQGLHNALNWNINKFVWALSAVKEKKTN